MAEAGEEPAAREELASVEQRKLFVRFPLDAAEVAWDRDGLHVEGRWFESQHLLAGRHGSGSTQS